MTNQIRGLMKTFGLIIPRSAGGKYEANVPFLLGDNTSLARIILPLLEAWRGLRIQATELGRQHLAEARRSEQCQLLMSIPGVGAITATSYLTAVEDPANFRRSRSVGAWLGLTTRRYQSGEVDYDGHISRRGDTHVRSLLYKAAVVILTRSHADSNLRS
jgi:transposase